MSLFKGFSVVGLASQRDFFPGKHKALSGLCARAQTGLALTWTLALAWGWASRQQGLCAIVPASHAPPRVPAGGIAWTISERSASFLSSFSAFFWPNSYTQSPSVWLSGKIECLEDNGTLHYNRVIQSWGGCLGWRTPNYAWLVNTSSHIMLIKCYFMFNSYATIL